MGLFSVSWSDFNMNRVLISSFNKTCCFTDVSITAEETEFRCKNTTWNETRFKRKSIKWNKDFKKHSSASLASPTAVVSNPRPVDRHQATEHWLLGHTDTIWLHKQRNNNYRTLQAIIICFCCNNLELGAVCLRLDVSCLQRSDSHVTHGSQVWSCDSSLSLSSALRLSVCPSGASPLGSSWTRRVGGRQQLLRRSTPLPLLRLLRPSSSSSSCRRASFTPSLLLVSLSLFVPTAARSLRHLHRGVTA